MRREILMALALACAGAACNDDAVLQSPTDTSEASATGSITISLVGTDSKGAQYRLRGAEFLIAKEGAEGSDAGPTPLVTLSTELDPDATYLSTRLAPGFYRVTLRGPWYIEQLGPTGAQRVERAVLLGGSTQRTHVVGASGAALVFYRFGIDGDVVDFNTGELRIGVDFQLPRDAGMDGGTDAGGEVEDDAGVDAGAPDAGNALDDAGEGLDGAVI